MTVKLNQRLLSVQEYHKMAAVGILTTADHVELLNGKIINMSPIGSKHAAIVEKIADLLKFLLKDKAMVRTQNPVLLDTFSEPEPDIVVVKSKANYYADGHPEAKDIYLLIEVADSSLETDRQAKLPLYASAKIKEYWIANIEKRELEVYTTPEKDSYKSKQVFPFEENGKVAILGFTCNIKDLLI